LPSPAHARLTRDPEAFSQRIERRIREFDGEGSGLPPEETLALLAAAAREPSAGEATAEGAETPDPASAGDSVVAGSKSPDPASARKVPVLVWIAAALLALALAALGVLPPR
jgi:hypothetical protein